MNFYEVEMKILPTQSYSKKSKFCLHCLLKTKLPPYPKGLRIFQDWGTSAKNVLSLLVAKASCRFHKEHPNGVEPSWKGNVLWPIELRKHIDWLRFSSHTSVGFVTPSTPSGKQSWKKTWDIWAAGPSLEPNPLNSLSFTLTTNYVASLSTLH